MSNVIDFLERMGADAGLRAADAESLARELAAADVDEDAANAILARDASVLRDRIAPGTFYAILMENTPEEEEHEPEEDESSSAHLRRRSA